MAKKKAAADKAATPPAAPMGTKAQAIRDALKAGRDKSPMEIAADLTAQGWQVKPGEVSNIKSQLKAKRRRKRLAAKGEQAAPVPKRAATAPAAGDMISMGALEAAKKLVKELGGVDKAKQAINGLARLVD